MILKFEYNLLMSSDRIIREFCDYFNLCEIGLKENPKGNYDI
jgi:hypothetical protein